MSRKRLIGGGLIAGLAVLVGVGLWKTSRHGVSEWIVVARHPQGVMGTTCTLAGVVRLGDEQAAERALREAEGVLRAVEARMSVHLEDSEISGLNAAGAGEEVPLSPETLEVLAAAREAEGDTAGAFDTTCGPLIELWRRAGERGRLPTQAELAEAQGASGWDLIELTQAGAVKRTAAARVDLGGVAKGYAIDRAVEVLQDAGAAGGLVDVGGDLRCFGQPPRGSRWLVDVKDPFGKATLGRLELRAGAVCTSGSYARFTVIEGRRYSHILDPRSGQPADTAPSVTVVGAEALKADIWATALSVLGPEGLQRLPEGTEAMMVLGSGDDRRFLCTLQFPSLVRGPLSEELTIAGAQ